MQRILIIEDEVDIAELISFNLQRNQFDTILAHDGLEGLNKALSIEPDLIILDIMLPGMDGINVNKQLKRDPRTRRIPVIMLTAKAQTEDRITGLETGADDYITKPFSPKELVLRTQAILKRTTLKSSGAVLELGPFKFDKNTLSFYLNGQLEDLTATEFKLMIFLCERVNAPQDRSTLLKEVWGYSDEVHSRTLDTHMKRLRKKLEPYAAHLETVRGIGYRIVDKPSAS
ncbi:response regulator [Rubritalea profundi]|uniref:DNA-binding response regulator n=1 Tax=Rubritalea profundi TaxID=1658618 RepID=A0A2S7U076_9BACT|nr:response regulator transcription factor [Rubritalea profundi]PQJ27907.1 DNA-binding response regulator [Rubritalea profundi]